MSTAGKNNRFALWKNGAFAEFHPELVEGLSVAAESAAKSVPQRHALSARIGAARPARGRAHDAVQAARLRPDANAVAHALELGREALELRALLDFRRTVTAARARRGYGLLDVHAPIEHVHDRQRDVVDDRMAAGRADHHEELSLFVEHHRRSHRAARALFRFASVGDGLAVFLRRPG